MKQLTVYDLPPTMIKDLLSMLLTKKNWHLLWVFVVKIWSETDHVR